VAFDGSTLQIGRGSPDRQILANKGKQGEYSDDGNNQFTHNQTPCEMPEEALNNINKKNSK
jgi:hypothetical protein